MTKFTQEQVDAGAEALRQYEQGGRLLRSWEMLSDAEKKKWHKKAEAVLKAAACDS